MQWFDQCRKYILYECENFRDRVTIDGQDLYDYLSENEDKHLTLEIKEDKDKDSEGKLEDIIKISKKRYYNTIHGG